MNLKFLQKLIENAIEPICNIALLLLDLKYEKKNLNPDLDIQSVAHFVEIVELFLEKIIKN